jgi:hypothetical protein
LADYRHIVVFAGGIGITPMLPVLDRIRYWCKTDKAKKFPNLQNVTVVWTARHDNLSLVREFADRIYLRPQSRMDGAREVELPVASDRLSLSSRNGRSSHVQVTDVQNPVTAIGSSASIKERLIPRSLTATAVMSWDVHIHITGASHISSRDMEIVTNSGSKHVCQCARPDYAAIVKQIVASGSGSQQSGAIASPQSICAVLCGPAAMSSDAAKVCAGANIDYHIETFGW